MSLLEIQHAFSAAIYDDEPEALAGLVEGPRRAPPLAAIAVYQKNTRERLRSVLAQTFPVVVQLVGEQCFDQLARLHILDHPCKTSDLEQYGVDFPSTVLRVLDEQAALREAVPYLADMAKVEWMAHRAYFTANRSDFDFAAFAGLNEQQYLRVRFQLAADVSTIAVDWPIVELWHMHQPGSEVVGLSIAAREQLVVIERPRYRSQVREVDRPTFEALVLLEQNCRFEELMQGVPDVQNVLAGALEKGWITGFVI